jgi:predicted methyltransferase
MKLDLHVPKPRRHLTQAGLIVALLLTVASCANDQARPTAAPSTASAGEPAAAAMLSPAQIADIIASPDRSESDRRNDQRRMPAQMLAFIGLRPGLVALDVSAGGGYTTELLARAVGPTGKVYGQSAPRVPRPAPATPEGAASPLSTAAASAPPAGPLRPSPVALAARATNPRAGNIVAVVAPFEAPVPLELAPASLDLVTLMFNYHDLGFLGVDRARMNQAIYAGLKRGGIYVIADHAGRTGTGISESGTLHRIEEAFLRAEIEAAGFRLVASGEFLRNPADPRDRNTPEPPQPKDEFVLKFVKP